MSKFQIIIPMSGFGERFRKVGYQIPKPLIEVAGKPMIAHVIDMFPGENKFIFICNELHLQKKQFNMRNILLKYAPLAKIVSISAHKKGPVHAILQSTDYIDLNLKTIVNYCDFTCYWDWYNFKKIIENKKIFGAIPAYKDFHPHSMGKTNYAYIKEKDFRLVDIQEKEPFTKNKTKEFTSTGTYYFHNGNLMVKSFNEIVSNNLSINNEFYVSLSYKASFFNNSEVLIYPIQHFMQWGTPEDLSEYKKWHNLFENMIMKKDNETKFNHSIVMPMAGNGQRFVDEGYNIPKPSIPISGLPMVIQATKSLPEAINYYFILRNNINQDDNLVNLIKKQFSNTYFQQLNKVTEGQACTVNEGIKQLKTNNLIYNQIITVGVCDAGIKYNPKKLENFFNDKSIDVLVWTRKTDHISENNPNMFGWVYHENNIIKKVLVKKSFSSNINTAVISGIFSFRNVNVFEILYEKLISNKNKVNGEFYLDSIIDEALKLNIKCVNFELDEFISWGTPNELKIFQYWQSCFHKWNGNKYSLMKDNNAVNKVELAKSFYIFEN